MEAMVTTMLNRFAYSVRVCPHVQLCTTLLTGDTVHFLFKFGQDTAEFCASVAVDDSRWYFRHLEAITIDLSHLPDLPCTGVDLPDLPTQQLDWIREEFLMTERVRLYNFLAQEKSREFALAWFKDGDGFALAAQAWIPYLEPRVAFIWYAAWSETHLHGCPVTLVKAGPDGAILRLTDPLHRRLYQQTGHLKYLIAAQDYEALFEVMWQDRARAAGWKLDIAQGDSFIELCFFPRTDVVSVATR
jgi:hypothetical protein